MKCRDCKFWEPLEDPIVDGFGECKSTKFIYHDRHVVSPDSLVYWDYEGYSAGFETGPEFGCVHFEKKQ